MKYGDAILSELRDELPYCEIPTAEHAAIVLDWLLERGWTPPNRDELVGERRPEPSGRFGFRRGPDETLAGLE